MTPRKFKKSSAIVSRANLQGGVTLMDRRRTECFFALDGIAAETWKLIDGKRTTDQIIAQLVRKHRPPVTRFKQDFTRLIRNLNREKLIEEA